MKKWFLIVNLLLSVTPIFCGNSGIIQGKIIDAVTGEEITGARIEIRGINASTNSGFDGNFYLNDLEPGIYTITISFISFQPVVYHDIVVESGKTTTINAKMNETTTRLKAGKLKPNSNSVT